MGTETKTQACPSQEVLQQWETRKVSKCPKIKGQQNEIVAKQGEESLAHR